MSTIQTKIIKPAFTDFLEQQAVNTTDILWPYKVAMATRAAMISQLIDQSINRKLIGNYFDIQPIVFFHFFQQKFKKILIIPGSEMLKFATFLGLAL